MTDPHEEGAQNLLVNCAKANAGEKLLLICEDHTLGWYDREIANIIDGCARNLGLSVSRLDVGAPDNEKSAKLTDTMSAYDLSIFLSRIGDQDRFSVKNAPSRTVMSYARDLRQLSSAYGCTHHQALVRLKSAVDTLILSSSSLRITCPLGTNMEGRITHQKSHEPTDVSVERFPLGVAQPVLCNNFSGRVALTRFLTPTGSSVYQPTTLSIPSIVYAKVEKGQIVRFNGNKETVTKVHKHYDHVAKLFGIDGSIVHSFHAGIHPGASYQHSASDDPDRWSNNVFTNPRFLHFHTCGAYAPGEICWMVLNPTINIDGDNLWEHGQLMAERFQKTRACLDEWPELISLFKNPSNEIGI